MGISEVPQPPADGDKPGMCAALQKPGILVALFKVPYLLSTILVQLLSQNAGPTKSVSDS